MTGTVQDMKSAKEPDAALCFPFITGVQKTILGTEKLIEAVDRNFHYRNRR